MFAPAYPARLAATSSPPGQRTELPLEFPPCVPLSTEVERQLGSCRRYRCSLAVLCFSIDNLPEIEQRCGEFVKRQVLNLVWARLWTGVREQDVALHTGRGQFAVLIRDALTPIATLVTARVAASLREAYRVNDLVVHLGVSTGYALRMPDDDFDGNALAAAAAAALSESRQADSR